MRAFTRKELNLILKTYGRWVDMVNRCKLPTNKIYHNYEPGNIYWATEKYGLHEECIYSRFRAGDSGERLFRPSFELFSVGGKTIHELAITTGLNENTIRNRYGKGCRGEELTQPLIKVKRPRRTKPANND